MAKNNPHVPPSLVRLISIWRKVLKSKRNNESFKTRTSRGEDKIYFLAFICQNCYVKFVQSPNNGFSKEGIVISAPPPPRAVLSFMFTVSLVLFSSKVSELSALSFKCTQKKIFTCYAWLRMTRASNKPTRADLLSTWQIKARPRKILLGAKNREAWPRFRTERDMTQEGYKRWSR